VDPSGLDFSVTQSWLDDFTFYLQLEIVRPESVTANSLKKDELTVFFEGDRYSFVS
jgi:hypothetical protein